ncbi:d D carboxypeptidase [Ruminococcus sp. CAG:382]|nr:d D carboxypeptidase [Ruminococcus sp. CAG:382]
MSNKSRTLTFCAITLVLCAAILSALVLNRDNGETVSGDISSPSQIVSEVFSDSESGSETEHSEEIPSEVSLIDESDDSTSSESEAFPAFRVDEEIQANYLVLYDATNDRFLYERNAEKRCYPASITKLLTALTACDYLSPGDIVTVGNEITMIGQGSSTAFLQVGFQLTFEQLMDSMMIVSGNDAAYVMAVWAGRKMLGTERGSAEAALNAFMERANEKAVNLGMTDTHFTNPDGYHDSNHYTTPRDLAYLCKAALNNPIIAESCKKTSVRYMIVSGQTVNYENTNTFLKNYPYATGLKTGTTNEAGFCLAASAYKDGRELVSVIIGAKTTTARFTDAAAIFDIAYGLSQRQR